MDKTVDSGSTDTGSIPVRDTKALNINKAAWRGIIHRYACSKVLGQYISCTFFCEKHILYY